MGTKRERFTPEFKREAVRLLEAGDKPAAGLIHHTDRGALYRSGEYRRLLEAHRIQPSMGRKGDCWDNAVAESFFSTLKNELVHGMRFIDRDHGRREIVSFIEGQPDPNPPVARIRQSSKLRAAIGCGLINLSVKAGIAHTHLIPFFRRASPRTGPE